MIKTTCAAIVFSRDFIFFFLEFFSYLFWVFPQTACLSGVLVFKEKEVYINFDRSRGIPVASRGLPAYSIVAGDRSPHKGEA